MPSLEFAAAALAYLARHLHVGGHTDIGHAADVAGLGRLTVEFISAPKFEHDPTRPQSTR